MYFVLLRVWSEKQNYYERTIMNDMIKGINCGNSSWNTVGAQKEASSYGGKTGATVLFPGKELTVQQRQIQNPDAKLKPSWTKRRLCLSP